MGKKFKNKIISDDGIKLIVEDNQGKTFSISKEDEWVLKNYWGVKSEGYVHRGIRMGEGGKIRIGVYLHRILTNAPDDMLVDHKDGNKTNNCRENLRLCTQQENNHNSLGHPKRRKSKYKGVCWCPRDKKWIAAIIFNYKKYYLGRHLTEELAAEAVNIALVKYQGEFAKLNIIHNPQD